MPSSTIRESLHSAAARYAAGVDQRDRQLFLSAFSADATIVLPQLSADSPARELNGHNEIGSIIERIVAYPKTFHLLGQARYDVDDAVATGEVYCVAHHITAENDHNLVMYIRYDDTYRPDPSGDWKIARRGVQIDWTETRKLK